MIQRDSDKLEISIVIPAYNEEQRISGTLQSIKDHFSLKGTAHEIIVVNDGSSDNTSNVAASFSDVYTITLEANQGKGAAVKRGMLEAKGTYVLFCDADGSTPIEEIERLQSALHTHQAQVAIGSRAIAQEGCQVRTVWYRKLLGRTFHCILGCLGVSGIQDTQCGFKLFSKEAAYTLFSKSQSNGFAFDVEILLLARAEGYRVIEVPVNWVNVTGSKVNLLIDPIRMFCDIVRIRLRLLGSASKRKFTYTA